jgi:hypothetical protein
MIIFGTWTSILDTGQIMDDLVPTRRLEGDVVCREYWILDTGYWILDTGYWILDTNNKVYLYGIFMSRKI